MNKVVASPEEALADIQDGATVAFAGFGLLHQFPVSLLTALRDKGTKDITIVCNSLGGGKDVRSELVERHQVKKLIAAFTARPGSRGTQEDMIASGELEAELVPQGILVERCRAAAAGIPAFYSPVAVGTLISTKKDVRFFDGKPFVMEAALPLDYALLRAWKADTHGNVVFRGSSRNFNPPFAKAARVACVEVDEIVEPGELDSHEIDLPGVWVDRVVKATITQQIATLVGPGLRRAANSAKTYNGKPALTREAIAKRASELLPDGSYVNLGVGLPTLISNFVVDRDVTLHAENGILGYGGLAFGDDVDPDVFNAGGQFVFAKTGTSYFDSVESFEIARSGRLDAVVLGAYQVDEEGNLANWTTPDQVGGGIGGAMDLVVGAKQLIITMEHRDSHDRPKLMKRCEYPLTGEKCVDVVVTDLAVLIRHGERFTLEEIAPGFTVEEIVAMTPMEIHVANEVRVIK